MLAATGALYVLGVVWGDVVKAGAAAGPTQETIHVLWWTMRATTEELYLWVVLPAGALGAVVAEAHRYVDGLALGEPGSGRNVLACAVRLAVGMGVALTLYFAVRGGLGVDVGTHGLVLNPYAIGALAVLAGLFAGQILDKFRAWLGLTAVPNPADDGEGSRPVVGAARRPAP